MTASGCKMRSSIICPQTETQTIFECNTLLHGRRAYPSSTVRILRSASSSSRATRPILPLRCHRPGCSQAVPERDSGKDQADCEKRSSHTVFDKTMPSRAMGEEKKKFTVQRSNSAKRTTKRTKRLQVSYSSMAGGGILFMCHHASALCKARPC